MTVITYGTSVKENAKSRRHARRRAVAIERERIESIIDTAFGTEKEVVAVEVKHISRIEKAVDTETEYHKQILAGAAAYVEHHISSKYQRVCNEAGRQIHAVQKMRGKSIPLI